MRPGVLAMLRYRAGRLGWPALLGFALAAYAASFEFTGVRDARERLALLQAEIAALRSGAPRAELPRRTPEQQVQDFLAHFPPARELPDMLETLHAVAADHGLAMDTVEYREVRDGDTGLLRYQVVLPVKGSYPQLRAWLGNVMNRLPAASLDEFNLKRDSIGNPVVDARVRLTLYLGGA